MKSISIVIPALNEEEGIVKTINAIPKAELMNNGYEIQILVVDGKSSDNTVERAKEAGAEVIIEPKPGYGRAYKTGFAHAKGEIIVTTDADGTYPVEDIPRLVQILKHQNLEFITTNRLSLIDNKTMSFRNRVGNNILAIETRLLFGLNIKDPESGMWTFNRNILEKLELKSDNNTFSHEIKIEACHYSKCRWLEVPVQYKLRSGTTKLTNGWDGWKGGLTNLFHIITKRLIR